MLGHAVALLFFLLLACLQTWPLALHLTDGLIGLSGERVPNNDITIFLWNFWWVKKALFELHQSPFYCNWLGQPGPSAFVFPTLSLQNSLAALPLSALSSLETAYNVLIIATLALTGWSAYLLANDLIGSRGKCDTRNSEGVRPCGTLIRWPASVLAGLLYGTTPLQVSHVAQINVFTLYWIPLGLLAARRFVATKRKTAAVAFGLIFLCNALADWYHTVQLAILLALLSAIKVWQARSATVRNMEKRWWLVGAICFAGYIIGGMFNIFAHFAWWLIVIGYFLVLMFCSRNNPAMQRLVARLTACVAVVALFSLPIALPMHRAIEGEQWVREVPFVAKSVFSADFVSYLLPVRMVERLFPTQRPADVVTTGARASGSSNVFPGYVAWAILAGAVAWWIGKNRRGGHWLFAAAVFVMLSLGPLLRFGGVVLWDLPPSGHVVLPAMLFEFLPVLEGVRVFARFAFVAYLCAALFVALQVADLICHVRREQTRCAVLALIFLTACLLVVERLDLPQPVGRVPKVQAFEWLRSQPQGVVLLYPMFAGRYENLYSQTRHEKPMVNPYVTRRPEDLEEHVEQNVLLLLLSYPRGLELYFASGRPSEPVRRAWNELGARWIVVSRRADARALLPLRRLLSETVGLALAYEDEDHLIYEDINKREGGKRNAD